ncbi:hypothetical protein B0H17DRAFT_1275037 [Mycena rosella]|uniref:Uncharacterized protein n=1 Tax=Mycena rosella TaxID=1033263 RepID=A0AAD7C9L0_MYCRO|nr:hypothetical protein B0H17DRAFT_1275037 [Mycena rosella]
MTSHGTRDRRVAQPPLLVTASAFWLPPPAEASEPTRPPPRSFHFTLFPRPNDPDDTVYEPQAIDRSPSIEKKLPDPQICPSCAMPPEAKSPCAPLPAVTAPSRPRKRRRVYSPRALSASSDGVPASPSASSSNSPSASGSSLNVSRSVSSASRSASTSRPYDALQLCLDAGNSSSALSSRSSQSLSRTVNSSQSSVRTSSSASKPATSKGFSSTSAHSSSTISTATSPSVFTSIVVVTISGSTSTTSTTTIPPSSIFTSTVIVTLSDSTSTVIATGPGVLNTGAAAQSTPFSRNVGGIIGIAIGSVVVLLLGLTAVFFGCRHWRRRRVVDGPDSARSRIADESPVHAQPETEGNPEPDIELSELTPPQPHYTLRRPTMLPTPPSSSSVAGLVGHGGGPPPGLRIAPGEFQGAAATTSPRSPRPGSLLNPPIVSPPTSPTFAPATPPTLPSPAASEERSTPKSLLRPNLAVLQGQSFGDHEDYSRRIGARVSTRMDSDMTVEGPEEEGASNAAARGYAY